MGLSASLSDGGNGGCNGPVDGQKGRGIRDEGRGDDDLPRHFLAPDPFPFTLIDHEHLAAATVLTDGKLAIKDQRYRAIILPQDVQLPLPASEVLEKLRRSGGQVLFGPTAGADVFGESLIKELRPTYRIVPASGTMALGQFVRDGRRIVLLANVGRQKYSGHVAVAAPGAWQVMDPANGSVQPAEHDAAGRIRLSLDARQAVLLVQSGSAIE